MDYILIIPESAQPPGTPEWAKIDIEPGEYNRQELASLLRKHQHNPEAIYFIADMLDAMPRL